MTAVLTTNTDNTSTTSFKMPPRPFGIANRGADLAKTTVHAKVIAEKARGTELQEMLSQPGVKWVWHSLTSKPGKIPLNKLRAAIWRHDTAQLELVRRKAIETTVFLDWELVLDSSEREAVMTPLSLVDPDFKHRRDVAEALMTVLRMEKRDRETTTPRRKKGKGKKR